jgi:hypothetical protein
MKKFETKNASQSFICREVTSSKSGTSRLSCEASVKTPKVQAGNVQCFDKRSANCGNRTSEFQLTLEPVDGFWN